MTGVAGKNKRCLSRDIFKSFSGYFRKESSVKIIGLFPGNSA
jgi:hypothetical protein